MIEDENVLMTAVLTEFQIGQGRTRLLRNGADVTKSTRVIKIIQYADFPVEFYLIRYGSDGGEVGDTYHESVGEALRQAEQEFGIRSEQWLPNSNRG